MKSNDQEWSIIKLTNVDHYLCYKQSKGQYAQLLIYSLKEFSLYAPAGQTIAAGAGANFVPSWLASKEFDPSAHKT